MAFRFRTPFGGKSSFIRKTFGMKRPTDISQQPETISGTIQTEAEAKKKEEQDKIAAEEAERAKAINEATEKIIAGRKPEEVEQRKRATFLRARMGLLQSPLGEARQVKTESNILGQQARIREAAKTSIELANKQAQFEREQSFLALQALEDYARGQERSAFNDALIQGVITIGGLFLSKKNKK